MYREILWKKGITQQKNQFFTNSKITFIVHSIGGKEHVDRSICDKSTKIGTNHH